VNSIKNSRTQNVELINEHIPNVKLLFIDDEGNKIGIISKAEAMRYAEEKDLDLVVVSPNSKPMVAKLMDYSKYRYEQQKKLREAKKNQKTVELKEIKLRPTIDKHDFDTKVKHGLRFLEKGNKIKISVYYRGRMITHKEAGKEVVDRFISALGDNIHIETRPKMEGRSLIAIVAPEEKK
jgi:translation initiation factor IF-3